MSRWNPDLAGNFGGDGKYDSFRALGKLLAERPLNIATIWRERPLRPTSPPCVTEMAKSPANFSRGFLDQLQV
jgi:hypothetical protein